MSDESYEAFMDATYSDPIHVKTFIPYEAPFQDASFYSPGAVANVTKGYRTVEIDVVGDLYIYKDEIHIRNSRDLRMAFPDGNLDLDEWSLENNRWFEFSAVRGGKSFRVYGGVAYDYDEAMSFAKDILDDEDVWAEEPVF